MEYTREQLVKAMQETNKKYLSDVDNYGPIDTTRECAEEQIDAILSNVKS